MGKLEQKVAIVTGGGTGIGKGIAASFLEEGASVVLAQRRLEVVRGAAAQLDPAGKRVKFKQVDISKRGDAEDLVQFTVREFGRVDILVNNASITGMPAIRPFLEMDDDFVHRMIDVNLKGTIYCSQAAARVMKEQGSGVIIHISSVAAYAAQEGASAYCATKSGYLGLTQGMALELIRYGIRVNCIAPGDIEIETNQENLAELRVSGVSGDYFRKIPAGRRGHPREIGKVAAFLASEDASYILGETIVVDGGFLIY